jgi:flagellar protein FliS
MCYEKAIQLLYRAKEHLQEQEIEKKVYEIKKVIDIINELNGALDMAKGGQIAINLQSIYSYLIQRILSGDINKDPSAYDEAITILSELKEAWEQILYQEKNQASENSDQNEKKYHFSQVAA